ncbi:MAG TPA: riboflavin synthase [Desulfuromonadales bacterium]|nr:riboflavin synthase [Desulfuromonadales bacterium]
MFTGLIEDLGTVRELRRESNLVRLTVGTAIPATELHLGDSVAVNGICLTVVAIGNGSFTADVSPETLDRSTLGELAAGSRVNLERALRLSDRLGGHLVSGHIDAIATISERLQDRNAIRFTFRLPAAVNRFVAEKGSVAIDGISLTVNAVTDETFAVAVIPHTLAMTTLQEKKSGDRVNVETDLIARYIARLLGVAEARPTGALSLDFLAKHGFL